MRSDLGSLYHPDPHLVADIFKVCSIPHFTTSNLKKEVGVHQSQSGSNLPSIFHTYLVVFLYKIVKGLSAPPEEFLLASPARRLPPGQDFAQ